MAKLFRALLFLLLLGETASATHLMGGDITVRPDGNGKYILRVTHYRDITGVPAATSLYVLINKYNPTISGTTGVHLPLLPNSGQALANFPYGVEVYVYEDTLPSMAVALGGSFRVAATECCRNTIIQNIANPGAEELILVDSVRTPAVGTNTSPEFLAMPVVYLPVNQPWTYNPLPYDADGDSLSWAIINPMIQSAYTLPSAAPGGPFTINPVSGEVSWTPNQLGHSVAAFKITEYVGAVKAGHVTRDMQYVVVPAASSAILSFAPVTPAQTNTTAGYNYVLYTPGQPLTFKIRGGDAGSPDSSISMTCMSPLFTEFAPTFTSVATGTGNTREGTFTWTPPAGFSKDMPVVFRVRNAMFAKDYTLMLRRNPSAASVAPVETDAVSGLQVSPNPAGDKVTVRFQTATDGPVRVVLTDVMGKTVAKLHDGPLPRGQWQMSEVLRCAPGLYQLTVYGVGGTRPVSQKVVVVR